VLVHWSATGTGAASCEHIHCGAVRGASHWIMAVYSAWHFTPGLVVSAGARQSAWQSAPFVHESAVCAAHVAAQSLASALLPPFPAFPPFAVLPPFATLPPMPLAPFPALAPPFPAPLAPPFAALTPPDPPPLFPASEVLPALGMPAAPAWASVWLSLEHAEKPNVHERSASAARVRKWRFELLSIMVG
jgi:hypothetical protein